MQAAMGDCVKDEYWKIHLPGGELPSAETVNFLEYVGTHLLARDIDRLRESFGAEKLSCYGFSYGTGVCSTYAAQFPDKLGEQPFAIIPSPLPPPPPRHPCPQICSS